MRLAGSTVVCFPFIQGLMLAASLGVAHAAGDEAALRTRSVVSGGDTARIQQAMDRARQGGPVTVAVIGGSITQGAKATRPENRYGNLVADWWRRGFPRPA